MPTAQPVPRPQTTEEILRHLLGGNPGEVVETRKTTYVLPEGTGGKVRAILGEPLVEPDWFTPNPPLVNPRISWRKLARFRALIRKVGNERGAQEVEELTADLDATVFQFLADLLALKTRCEELDAKGVTELSGTVSTIIDSVGRPEVLLPLKARLEPEVLGPGSDPVGTPVCPEREVAQAASSFFDVPVTKQDLAYVVALEPKVDFGAGSGYLRGSYTDKDAAEDYWGDQLQAVADHSVPE